MNSVRCSRLNIASGGTTPYASQWYTKKSTPFLWYSWQQRIQSTHEQLLSEPKLRDISQNKKSQGHKRQRNIKELFQTKETWQLNAVCDPELDLGPKGKGRHYRESWKTLNGLWVVFKFFYWGTVDLQYHVSFRCTTQRCNYICVCIYILF